jgi:hypothetical protein
VSATTPTALSVHWLRDHGWIADKVEQRLPIPGAKFPTTKDAFGFGDILAAHPSAGVLLVQATSRPNVNARITKVTADQILGKSRSSLRAPSLRPNPVRLNLLAWLLAGGRFEVWGWSRRIPRGEAKMRTVCRRIVFGYNSDGLGWKEEPL